MPTWPLVNVQKKLPPLDGQGAFGAPRKHDVHTGVDLYCPEGTEVVAIKAGTVVNIVWFTGQYTDPPSAWWNDTQGVLVDVGDEVHCYGEVLTDLKVGDRVEMGQRIGHVKKVLKKDKGKPMSMLHLEAYEAGTVEPVWWYLDQPKPDVLRDPTPMLLALGGSV
jgi:murein DD-endopeptidase MepM/ murein hydrolase activator NlpD